jgi:cytochrome c-type biogenesis protein CcmH
MSGCHSPSERIGRRAVLMIAALAFALPALGVSAQAESRVEADARALEQRLRAPCCRAQLLDAHESEATHALRRDIRAQLARGETSAEIERALVQRYGESIVAVPLDRDPRAGLSLVLAIVLASTALLLSVFAARWVRRASAVAQPERAPAEHAGDAALDARIDAELRRQG